MEIDQNSEWVSEWVSYCFVYSRHQLHVWHIVEVLLAKEETMTRPKPFTKGWNIPRKDITQGFDAKTGGLQVNRYNLLCGSALNNNNNNFFLNNNNNNNNNSLCYIYLAVQA